MAKKSVYLKLVAVFALGVIVGVGFFQLYFNVVQQGPSQTLSLDHMYQNAIEDAMVAKPREIYSSLTPIAESNGNLTWRGDSGNKSVLVVTFTKYASSYPVGETVNTTWGETWVTMVPEIKTFFKTHADANSNVTLRALQLLGLSANNSNI